MHCVMKWTLLMELFSPLYLFIWQYKLYFPKFQMLLYVIPFVRTGVCLINPYHWYNKMSWTFTLTYLQFDVKSTWRYVSDRHEKSHKPRSVKSPWLLLVLHFIPILSMKFWRTHQHFVIYTERNAWLAKIIPFKLFLNTKFLEMWEDTVIAIDQIVL